MAVKIHVSWYMYTSIPVLKRQAPALKPFKDREKKVEPSEKKHKAKDNLRYKRLSIMA